MRAPLLPNGVKAVAVYAKFARNPHDCEILVALGADTGTEASAAIVVRNDRRLVARANISRTIKRVDLDLRTRIAVARELEQRRDRDDRGVRQRDLLHKLSVGPDPAPRFVRSPATCRASHTVANA